MFKNYLKIIKRSLWRNKLYTLINIFGLGVGIAAVVWGFQTYRFSVSYDNFHKDRTNIFRVLTKGEETERLKGICPTPLAIVAKNDFADVKESVRWASRGLSIKADQNEPFASYASFTDPAFFDFFNFPLLRGTINLKDPSTILLTEKSAKKFFGSADPIGKTISLYSDQSFKKALTVTGILKDVPVNSSLRFEEITSIDNLLKTDGSINKNDDWSWFADAVFLKLSNPSQAAALSKAFDKYIPMEQASGKNLKLTAFSMEPLSQVANDRRLIDDNYLAQGPEDAATYAPLILALLILLSACLNFANTTVAQCTRRLKEIGVRKVMGSSYGQIIFQQLLECSFIVLLAILLSVVINNLWIPTFNGMFLQLKVTADYFQDQSLMIFLSVLLVGVTVLAGAYPAFYISKFNATNIFRGSVKFGGNNFFSRMLLGFQIVISFITVIAGMAFSRNSEFQRTYDFGYDRENTIGLNLQGEAAFNSVRNELNNISGIEKMAGTRDQVGFSYRGISLEAKGEKKTTRYFETGGDYLEVMNLKLVAGRGFTASGIADYNKSILINERLAYEFGWKATEALGKQIRRDDSTLCTVVGVLKDITQNTLFEPLQPIAMCMVAPEKYSQIVIKTKAGELNQVFEKTKAAWAKLYPMKPFMGYYQDQIAAESSLTNQSIATIFFWFAIISVVLASTGMFALVSLSVMNKMREIAIRKVMGATGKDVLKLVIKGYTWIFLLAAAIGCYAGYSLSGVLMDMIFRRNSGVSLTSLTLSFLCVLLISSFTIGSRVIYAMHRKPTDVLKSN